MIVMFIAFFQTYVNNNGYYYASRDVLLSTARNNTIYVIHRQREREKDEKSIEYPNEKTFDQQW